MIIESKENETNSLSSSKKMLNSFKPSAYLFTNPSSKEISKLSEKSLAQVPYFRIWNEFGEIEYLEPVDLRFNEQKSGFNTNS